MMTEEQLDVLLKTLTDEIAALRALVVLDDECMRYLRLLHSSIWIEAWYDAGSKNSVEFARSLDPLISALNEKLKFKV